MEIAHSHWVHLNHIYEVNVHYLILKRSTLSSDDLKSLVERWREGWTPEWTHVEIFFATNVNVESCIDEKETNGSSQVRRFKETRETNQGIAGKTGYHIRRSDYSIATISVRNEWDGSNVIPKNPLPIKNMNVYSKVQITERRTFQKLLQRR